MHLAAGKILVHWTTQIFQMLKHFVVSFRKSNSLAAPSETSSGLGSVKLKWLIQVIQGSVHHFSLRSLFHRVDKYYPLFSWNDRATLFIFETISTEYPNLNNQFVRSFKWWWSFTKTGQLSCQPRQPHRCCPRTAVGRPGTRLLPAGGGWRTWRLRHSWDSCLRSGSGDGRFTHSAFVPLTQIWTKWKGQMS